VKRCKRPVIFGGSTRISQPLNERLLLRQVAGYHVDDDYMVYSGNAPDVLPGLKRSVKGHFSPCISKDYNMRIVLNRALLPAVGGEQCTTNHVPTAKFCLNLPHTAWSPFENQSEALVCIRLIEAPKTVAFHARGGLHRWTQ
jgi:hypothetical protein